ncbi:MAG TPA: esterase-like activity of phytase family protein [Sphingomicrobium sp.]|nr:esterase-like activity of phytase family protein [Sphingomicrobium sp.]
MQREFRKSWLIPGTLLAFMVLFCRSLLDRLPNRLELGPRSISLHYQPVGLNPGSDPGFRVIGAWRLLAEDPRFGGLSALALTRDGFVAVTDSGVVVRFPRPTRPSAKARLAELPGGPGAAGFKVNRDSEALAGDPLGRGWWVAFENRDELWLYDPSFGRALGRAAIRGTGLRRNRGIEGMVADRDGLLLFPESGGKALAPGRNEALTIEGVSGWVSDATVLPDGSLAVVNRRPTPIGLSNRLVMLERLGPAYRPSQSWRIPVGRLDNVEGVAAEPGPGGAMRLWMVTDNNLQKRRPTLLIGVELRPRPARPPSSQSRASACAPWC